MASSEEQQHGTTQAHDQIQAPLPTWSSGVPTGSTLPLTAPPSRTAASGAEGPIRSSVTTIAAPTRASLSRGAGGIHDHDAFGFERLAGRQVIGNADRHFYSM